MYVLQKIKNNNDKASGWNRNLKRLDFKGEPESKDTGIKNGEKTWKDFSFGNNAYKKWTPVSFSVNKNKTFREPQNLSNAVTHLFPFF